MLLGYDEAIFVGSETDQDAYTNLPFKQVNFNSLFPQKSITLFDHLFPLS